MHVCTYTLARTYITQTHTHTSRYSLPRPLRTDTPTPKSKKQTTKRGVPRLGIGGQFRGHNNHTQALVLWLRCGLWGLLRLHLLHYRFGGRRHGGELTRGVRHHYWHCLPVCVCVCVCVCVFERERVCVCVCACARVRVYLRHTHTHAHTHDTWVGSQHLRRCVREGSGHSSISTVLCVCVCARARVCVCECLCVYMRACVR